MLTALIANIQDAIVLLDPTGTVVFESPSAASILGVAPDEGLGAFRLGRIHPDDRASVVESFERTRSTPGAVFRGTYRFQRGDGRWSHMEALARNLINDPELGGVLITIRDVTDRIRAMEAAERAAAARDEFLSRMSHELRSPLHAISGWAQTLRYDDDAEVREAGEQIVGAGAHLLRLVEDAMDLAAVQEGRISIEPRLIRVRRVVEQAMDLALPAADRREVRIHMNGPSPADAVILADPDRLRQVMLNLVSNAVKYNRRGGEVEIGWEPNGDARWRIHVRDTGHGIPEAMFDRLFERFDRLGAEDSEVEGSGLGLAISRRLVELMGGSMGVRSTPGEGSTFWIDLRAVPEPTAKTADFKPIGHLLPLVTPQPPR